MNIVLYTHPQKDPELLIAEKIAEIFIKSPACNKHPNGKVFFDKLMFDEFCLDDERHKILQNKLELCNISDACKKSELVICIGGDGTILRGAKIACNASLPVLGINSGRIGYLAELEVNGIHNLENVFSEADKWNFDKRMLLDITVERNGKTVFSGNALNEAAITKGAVSRMIDLEITSRGCGISKYRADGLIISTPTGSTAYAMSAGGPIIDPAIECILVVPVCPYLAANSSPVIYSPESVLDVVFAEGKGKSAFVTIDGEHSFELLQGDVVCIKHSEKNVRLLKMRNIDFCRLLNMKLSEEVSK